MEQKEIKTGVNKVLIQSLGLSDKYLEKNILKKEVDAWDSLKHIMIVSDLEMEFDVMFEPEEMVELTGTDAIVNVLLNKDLS